MDKWIRKPQEHEANYIFSGPLFVTTGVLYKVSFIEIVGLFLDLQQFVKEKGAVDYLQVYESQEGIKVYFIDNIPQDLFAHPETKTEGNYCTLMLAEEY